MTEYAVAAVAVAVPGYALVAERLARTVITGPIVFTAIGLLLGPEALGVIAFGLDTQLIEVILSITLGLLLFTDATRIELATVIRFQSIPALVFVSVGTGLLAGLAPVPGGIGVTEATMSGLLTATGLPAEQAVSIAIVHRVVTAYLPPALGLFAFNWLNDEGYL